MELKKLFRIGLLVGAFTALAIAVAVPSRPTMATQQADFVYLPILTNLGNNLKHHWSFNEGEGRLVQDQVQSSNGTIEGDGDAWAAGPNNSSALLLNGDNYLRLNVPDMPPPWTASIWVRRMGTARGMALFSSPTHYLKLEQWPNLGRVGFNEWGVDNRTLDYVAPLDEWVHMTFVSTGADVRLFVNGAFVEETDFVMPLPLLVIGNNSNQWNEATIASIDELRVWDVAYSATDVLNLFNATNP